MFVKDNDELTELILLLKIHWLFREAWNPYEKEGKSTKEAEKDKTRLLSVSLEKGERFT